jgi:hypothetical protein
MGDHFEPEKSEPQKEAGPPNEKIERTAKEK